jgi:hypothetical protein
MILRSVPYNYAPIYNSFVSSVSNHNSVNASYYYGKRSKVFPLMLLLQFASTQMTLPSPVDDDSESYGLIC